MIDDAKNDKTSFNDLLENADITFDMFDIKDNSPIILSSICSITTRTKKFANTTDEYYIVHRFTEEQTSIKGRYEGVVTIQFLDENSNPTNKLIIPIKERLFINII
jgi:hypothetical protein